MITIGDRFAIQADDKQYTLCEVKTYSETAKRPGETYLETLGFYGSVSAACEAVVKRLMREQVQIHDMTLIDAARAYQGVQRCVDEWARGLVGDGV